MTVLWPSLHRSPHPPFFFWRKDGLRRTTGVSNVHCFFINETLTRPPFSFILIIFSGATAISIVRVYILTTVRSKQSALRFNYMPLDAEIVHPVQHYCYRW